MWAFLSNSRHSSLGTSELDVRAGMFLFFVGLSFIVIPIVVDLSFALFVDVFKVNLPKVEKYIVQISLMVWVVCNATVFMMLS